MLDWLYGPRVQRDTPTAQVTLRSLTLDIDTLFELSTEFANLVEGSGMLTEGIEDGQEHRFRMTADYTLRGMTITEDEIRKRDVADRNEVQLNTQVFCDKLEHGVFRPHRDTTLQVTCSLASFSIGAVAHPTTDHIAEQLASFLYNHGTTRPDWKGATWLRGLIPLPFALLAWLWLALTIEIPPALNLLVLAVLGLTIIPIYERAKSDIHNLQVTNMRRSFRFRGESRERTQQRRADERQNLKVGTINLIAGGFLGVVGTLITTAIIGTNP